MKIIGQIECTSSSDIVSKKEVGRLGHLSLFVYLKIVGNTILLANISFVLYQGMLVALMSHLR